MPGVARALGEVVVSYAPPDRPWAEWIARELDAADIRVRLRSFSSLPGAGVAFELNSILASSEAVVVVLSGNYLSVAVPEESSEPLDRPDAVWLARVDSTARLDLTPGAHEVYLGGSDEIEARRRLRVAGVLPANGDAESDRFPGMPLNVGYPTARPAIWRDVPHRNPSFVGRDALLEDLRDRLTARADNIEPRVLRGQPCVGKTNLAIEYASRFAADYQLVCWIDAGQPDLVAAQLAELARDLGIDPRVDLRERLNGVQTALRRGNPYRNWLVVFDNADEPEAVAALLPGGPGHVLATSRNPEWRRRADVLEVDVFDREESIQLLRRKTPGISVQDADAVADELGDLPMAVEQAGAWLDETGMMTEDYLQMLRSSASSVLSEGAGGQGERAVAVTWNAALDRLKDTSPAAARLLDLSAFLAPAPIPMPLLYSRRLTDALVRYTGGLDDPLLLPRLVRQINRLALARVDSENKTLQVHRVAQQILRERLSTEERARTLDEVQVILAQADPGSADRENWDRYEEILVHLRPAQLVASARPEVRDCVINLIRFLFARGDIVLGRSLAEEAVVTWRATSGPDDLHVLRAAIEHGRLLRVLAGGRAALDVDEDTYARLRAVVGPDHGSTLLVAQGIAADYRWLGDFGRALDLDRQTHGHLSELLGADHADTMRAAHNLAVSCRLNGLYTEALELDADTLSRRLVMYGEEHPESLYSANNLARDERECGRYRQSRDRQRRVVDTYIRLVGDRHQDTLRARKNLAMSYRKAGDYAVAHQFALDTRRYYAEKYADPEQPDTLAADCNLIVDHYLAGEFGDAIRLGEAVLLRHRGVFGSGHPFTLVTANNLATACRLGGARAKARPLSEGAYSGLRAALGDDHPFTLAGATNLATERALAGDLDEAVALGSDTVARSSARLGPDHPATLTAASNLAIDRAAAGADPDWSAARKLADTLGIEHPVARATAAARRVDADLEPPPY